jgi:hypothetical protein
VGVSLRGVLEGVDAYHGKGPNNDAAFWPAPTPGDVAYLEYFHPRGKRDAQLEIDVISHFYRDPGFLPPQAQPNVPGDPEGLLACQQSVMCHEVDETARNAVGRMIFDGGFLCSGALLNDVDANTFAGYFLTANHCISSQSSANSLTTYWFYQPASCGGPVPSLSTLPKSIGAKLLANSSQSDFSFLRFNNDPEDGQGLAAWTTTIPPASGAQFMAFIIRVDPGSDTAWGRRRHPRRSAKLLSHGAIRLQRLVGGNYRRRIERIAVVQHKLAGDRTVVRRLLLVLLQRGRLLQPPAGL